jgi:hypothetical protein
MLERALPPEIEVYIHGCFTGTLSVLEHARMFCDVKPRESWHVPTLRRNEAPPPEELVDPSRTSIMIKLRATPHTKILTINAMETSNLEAFTQVLT